MSEAAIDEIATRFRELRLTKGIGAAEPYLAEHVPSYPESHVLRGLWSMALLGRGRTEDAQQQADIAIQLDPDSHDARLALAKLQVSKGNVEGSIAIVQGILAEDPENAGALEMAVGHGLMWDDTGLDELIARLAAVADSKPESYQMLVLSKANSFEIEEAEQMLAEAPESYRRTYLFPLAKAKIALSSEDMEAVGNYYREAAAMASEADGPWAGLALHQSVIDQPDEAAKSAGYALEINSRNSIALGVLARLAERRGDTAESERIRRQITEKTPNLAFMDVIRRANLEQRKGNPLAAQKILQGLESHPMAFARRLALRQRLQYLLFTEREEEIERCLELATPEMQDIPSVIACRGKLALLRKLPGDALACIEERLRLAPYDHSAIVVWLEAKTMLGDKEEVREKAREWIARAPKRAAECAQYVTQLERLGYKAESDQLLEEARSRFPEDQVLKMTLVRKLLRRGRFVDATNIVQTLSGYHREAGQKLIANTFKKNVLRLLLTPKLWPNLFSRKNQG